MPKVAAIKADASEDAAQGFTASSAETYDPQVFTEHVRTLSRGEQLHPLQFEKVRRALSVAMRRELLRRGLWKKSPAYLGVVGGRWDESGALEELLAECYSYVFVSRRKSLEAQIRLKPNIEGLVILNIRHFLHERQREHDPIGFQVFEVLRSAVQLALEGELLILGGSTLVRNDTTLGFKRGLDSWEHGEADFSPLVARWNDELLPDLVTARGHRQQEIILRLRQRLPDLLQEGISTFRFGELVDQMKADVRARWAAILAVDQGEVPQRAEGELVETVVRSVGPDRGIENRESFRKLVECVGRSLAALEVDSKTRGYLVVLWQFLRMQASEGAGAQPAARLARAVGAGLVTDEGGERLSHRKLAELLQIPRDRLPRLYRTVGDLVKQCGVAISSQDPESHR